MNHFSQLTIHGNQPCASFESKLEKIRETHDLNEATFVMAIQRAFKRVGTPIALSGFVRDEDDFLTYFTGSSCRYYFAWRFLFYTITAGARSYFETIETEQFPCKEPYDEPCWDFDAIEAATAEMFLLFQDRVSNAEAKDKALQRIITDLMPWLIEFYRGDPADYYFDGDVDDYWHDRESIVSILRSWSMPDNSLTDNSASEDSLTDNSDQRLPAAKA